MPHNKTRHTYKSSVVTLGVLIMRNASRCTQTASVASSRPVLGGLSQCEEALRPTRIIKSTYGTISPVGPTLS